MPRHHILVLYLVVSPWSCSQDTKKNTYRSEAFWSKTSQVSAPDSNVFFQLSTRSNASSELCLATDGQIPVIGDCYTDATSSQLSVSHLSDGTFQVLNKGKCLKTEFSGRLSWADCLQNEQQTFTFREFPWEHKGLLYSEAYNRCLSKKDSGPWMSACDPRQAIFFYIRPSASLIPIANPESQLLDGNGFKTFVETTDISTQKKPNIYLFILETYRQDNISPENTPALAAIQGESLNFTKTFSGASATHHSFFSIFYSSPSYHREAYARVYGYQMGSPHLRVLKKAGYELFTFAWPAELPCLTGELAEANLWDLFSKDAETFASLYPNCVSSETHGPDGGNAGSNDNNLTNRFLDFYSKNRKSEGQFYLFYLFPSHIPYGTFTGLPESYNSRLRLPYYRGHDAEFDAYQDRAERDLNFTGFKNSYRNAAMGVDYQMGRIMTALKDSGDYGNAVIVVTADHGESLGENKFYAHGATFPYRAQTEIPLIFKLPEVTGASRGIGAQMDIFPTLFEYIGVSDYQASGFLGQSLLSSDRSCAVSTRPNLANDPVEFILFNGTHKLGLRFRNKLYPKLPIASTELEVIRYSDYEDHMILSQSDPDTFRDQLITEFTSCINMIAPGSI